MAASTVYDPAAERDHHHSYPAAQPYTYAPAYYYANGDGPHDSSPVRQVSAPGPVIKVASQSSQYYGDATAAVMPYGAEYTPPPAEEWSKHPHAAGPVQSYPTYYEPGEVSPTSDSSSSGTYDSPPQSHKASLAEDASGYSHPPFYASYDGAAAPYSAEPYTYQTHSAEHAHADMQPYYEHHQAYSSSPSYYSASPGDNHPRATRASGSAPVRRSPSPMGHLPYEDVQTYMPRTYCSPASQAYMYDAHQHHHAPVEQPQPLYAHPHPYSTLPAHQHYPTPIAIPASRSPPLVEDAPKKPLTLACFFCRKRKIACGSPPPGKKDRTCKYVHLFSLSCERVLTGNSLSQCARRNLRCEYPVNSRRGTRQREGEGQGYPAPAGYVRNPS